MEFNFIDSLINAIIFVTCWLVFERIIESVKRRNQNTEQTDSDKPQSSEDQLTLHVNIELNNGLWYGWLIDENLKEQFVAQGTERELAISSCVDVLKNKHSDSNIRILFYETNEEQTQRHSKSDSQEQTQQ
jgi:hypothetical protein